MQFRHKSIKNTIQLLVISFFLTAGVCDISAKERSSEFDLKDGMLLQIPGQKQSILLPRIGKSIPIQWNPWESKYVTLVFPGRISLPEFKRLSVIAYFRAPADTPVRRISLRLIDKNHENFQISQVPVIQEDVVSKWSGILGLIAHSIAGGAMRINIWINRLKFTVSVLITRQGKNLHDLN